MRDLVVSLRRAPGDTAVLTALLRDLALARPGEFRVWADVGQPELLRNNPHVFRAGRWPDRAWPAGVQHVQVEYGAGIVRSAREPVHFLAWPHRDFEAKTGLRVPVTRPHPDLHLTAAERRDRPVTGRYWAIVAGGKADAPVKVWTPGEWQRTVDHLRGMGLGVVQLGAAAAGHEHFPLGGTLDLVGRTTLREMLRVLAHADGVVCGLTFAMHAAAALGKPCVVVAGGREAWWWEAYHRGNPGLPHAATLPVPHRFLHAAGLLDCAKPGGCWRNQVVPGMGSELVCHRPVEVDGRPTPGCMTRITATHVAEAAMSYYEDGTLPPVGAPPALAAGPPAPVATLAGPLRPAAITRNHSAWDHPTLGGRLTAFVLLYGDYPAMHRECLDALLATTPRHRVEVRLLSNQLGAESSRYVEGLVAAGVATHAADPGNPGKYPRMRAAFRDPARPIATSYLFWLDDDSICRPGWFEKLGEAIVAGHPEGARLFGPPYQIRLRPGQPEWMRAGSWHRGRPFRDARGRGVEGGDRVHFAAGGAFALHVPTMLACDIPDARLEHCGGDVAVGEQVYQMGYGFAPFSGGKSLINYSAYPRRGRNEPPAGAS